MTLEGSTTPFAMTRDPSQSSNRAPATSSSFGASGERNCTSESVAMESVPNGLIGSTTMLQTASGQRSRESSNRAAERYLAAGGAERPPRSFGSQRIMARSLIQSPVSRQQIPSRRVLQSSPGRFHPSSQIERIGQRVHQPLRPSVLYTPVPNHSPRADSERPARAPSGSKGTCPRLMSGLPGISRMPAGLQTRRGKRHESSTTFLTVRDCLVSSDHNKVARGIQTTGVDE